MAHVITDERGSLVTNDHFFSEKKHRVFLLPSEKRKKGGEGGRCRAERGKRSAVRITRRLGRNDKATTARGD